MLGFNTADGLTHDQHLHLLRFLCDEVLDTEKMRTALQSEWATCHRARLQETRGSHPDGL